MEKRRVEEAAHRQSAVFVTPLNSAPPPPEFVAQTGEAGGEHPVMERDSGDVAMPDVIVPRQPPSEEARGKQPADPPAPPAGDEMATDPTPEVRTPTRRRLAKAASAPRPQETAAASSSIPDAEATSATPTGWVLECVGFSAELGLDVQDCLVQRARPASPQPPNGRGAGCFSVQD